MISTPKPQAVFYPRNKPRTQRRLPKVNALTIAIGMLCGNGAIVAADTQGCLTDGSTIRDRKVLTFNGANISFAIADASEDANAAKTLVRRIAARLGKEHISGWNDIEVIISEAMTGWYKDFTQAPSTSLIVSAILKGFGLQLYLCEPPNTVLPKPEGYVAAGTGSAVT